jgi:uncharacterized integral membrane protein (TIGR00697 family)
MFKSKRELVYIVLAGLFITNAIVAELIGGKIVQFGPFLTSIGIIPWPVVFLSTDIINEHFGKSGVKTLSIITASLIGYAFIILFFAINIPATHKIPSVNDSQFYAVFGQSMWIMVASIVAFLSSQFVDVFIFWLLRDKTGGKMMWLRSTGSTVVSQLIDTFVIFGIAFWLPGKMTSEDYLNAASTSYVLKLLIAVALTPLIYVGHNLIEKYLGDELTHNIVKHVAEEALHHKVEE